MALHLAGGTAAGATGPTLHVLTVLPAFGAAIVGQYFPADYEDKARAEAAKRLSDLTSAELPNHVRVETHLAEGRIYREILAAAERLKADVIVMGSHRPELQDYLLGPNAARVVRHAKCSVMVVRDA